MKRDIFPMALLLACLSPFASACTDENLIDNPSFDLWCGKKLCSWNTDQGRIERVGTWHRKDYAVSFAETPTQISQLSKNPDVVDCMLFDMIADVEPEAELTLMLDFDDDGNIEFEQRVPAVSWRSVQFVMHPPTTYDSVRFIMRKEGTGRAVLAQVRAVSGYECQKVPDLSESEE